MVSSVIPAVVCLLVAAVGAQNQNLDMFGLINMLYTKADVNMDLTITKSELGRIYEFMDRNNDSKISEQEFVGVWKVVTQFSTEVSQAYFLLADMDRNGILNSVDNDRIYQKFDLNGDGIVKNTEFSHEYQRVYHRVPFVVLFERVEKANNNDQHLSKTEFGTLFASFHTAADGSITKTNLQKDWVANRFGTAGDAKHIFDSLDANKNGSVSRDEIKAKFNSLDKSGNGKLEISEIEVMGDVVPVRA